MLIFRFSDNKEGIGEESTNIEFISMLSRAHQYPYNSEVYFWYTSNMLEIYFQSIFKINTSRITEEKDTSSPYYFTKTSTIKAHFVKLNQHLNVNLKCTSSIL